MANKSNLKRIRDILLSDTNDTDDDITDDQESDLDSDFDTSAIESDDTSADEHISEESDSSNSDTGENDIFTNSQPETIEKAGVTWSSYQNKKNSRISAAKIMKIKSGSSTKVQTILDSFKLFFTDELLDDIVFHTNRYAEQCFDQIQRSRQEFNTTKLKSRRWIPMDRVELESFIGLLIQSGINRSNHELLSELWDISQSRPLYRATMSLQRFKYLLRFIRFDDRQGRNKTDRLAPVRHMFERFVKQLPRHFIPSENLTIDEQLVPFRGRCRFVQYIPKKSVKYGLKFWVLSDADSRYVLSIDLYTGKKDNIIQKDLRTNVVLHLVDQLPNNVKQGRSITFDRYFTDLKLSEALMDRKMTSVGIVEHKRSFLPNELKLCRKELFASWFYFSGPHMLLSYQAKEKKKPVVLLSSAHEFAEVFDDEKRLPCAIHDYNQTKGGVDAIDQCIENYTVRRISRRWPMVVFYNMIDIGAINAMTIWLCQNSSWNVKRTNTRRIFLTQLSKALTNLQLQCRSKEVRLMPKVKLALQSLGYRLHSDSIKNLSVDSHLNETKRRCHLCPAQLGRKVRQTCHYCRKNVCLSHSRSVTIVTCQTCEENASKDFAFLG
ncbi:unnamed protein product [Rotaria sp. Silwood1]|nr:unnamed protein product [Rotaria sp. Silwood1]